MSRLNPKSWERIQAEASQSLAGAAHRLAGRPIPYRDEPDYAEGRLDYMEGVDYEMYAGSCSRYWRLGYLEAQAEYPNIHGDVQ